MNMQISMSAFIVFKVNVDTYDAGFERQCEDSQCSWDNDNHMQCKAVSCTLTMFLAARSMSAS